MDEGAVGFVEELRHHFRELNDPRVANRCDHRLMDIIAIVMLGTPAGAEDWPDFELSGTERQDWLGTFLELPCGIPSHDTFRRVFGLLDPQEFAACLFAWTQAIHEATGGKWIAIDGKQVRTPTDPGGGSRGRGRRHGGRSRRNPARRCCTW